VAIVADPDIWRSAAQLIRTHSNAAPSLALELAEGFKAEGDMDGWSIWRQISLAAEELLRSEPGSGERLN
jgi:hypothetical protein